MDYKKVILNLLLDKYENSRHYAGDAKVNRRIALIFDKKYFPQYDIENNGVKDAIHYSLHHLMQQDIISIQWVKYETGNLVDRIFLNTDNIDAAYGEAGRMPKRDAVSSMLLKLDNFKNTISMKWIIDFIEIQIGEIRDNKNFTKYIPDDEYITGLLIDALNGIDGKGSDEMLERVFSKKYLGDSKQLETRVRSRLCTIIREFYLKNQDISDEEVLSEVGIIKTAEDLLFCGPLKIMLNDNVIDFSHFVFGASVNTMTINNFQISDLHIDTMITIENKANYLEYIKNRDMSNCLVVYLGGFYSPVKRTFLKKVYDYVNSNVMEVDFFHWGDLDLGGFNIFMQLKSQIIDRLQPLYMDTATLIKHKDYGEVFDINYRKKLERLLCDPQYSVFTNVIVEMLKLGIKLEQEALL